MPNHPLLALLEQAAGAALVLLILTDIFLRHSMRASCCQSLSGLLGLAYGAGMMLQPKLGTSIRASNESSPNLSVNSDLP